MSISMSKFESTSLLCTVYNVLCSDLPTWRMLLEGHFARKKSGTCRQKAGRLAGPTLRFFFRSIQPTEINCVPKYTVARRFGCGRPTVWYFCEKSNGIYVITFNWVICINVGAPRQRYKLRARKKNKNDFVQKVGHFHDLAGRGTSGKKNGTVPPKAGRLAGRPMSVVCGLSTLEPEHDLVEILCIVSCVGFRHPTIV